MITTFRLLPFHLGRKQCKYVPATWIGVPPVGLSPFYVSKWDRGRTYTNSNSSGPIQYDLPPAESGLDYTFIDLDNYPDHDLTIMAYESETIGSFGNSVIFDDTTEKFIHIKCFIDGHWEIINSN